MINKTETDKFVTSGKTNVSTESNQCNSIWWNQGYYHQQAICRIIESFYFRVIIIFLVVLDTLFLIAEIMLDSLKIQNKCETYVHHISKPYYELNEERIELAMEFAHFSSIAILTFFVIELLVRIYASGKEFWNFHRRKSEYFDAFIVITSLAIDLYLLPEKKILGKKLLMFTFRLWRFVRIISSVAESVRAEQAKHKSILNKQYLVAIRQLIDIILHKTNYVENNSDQLNCILEHFLSIDNHCQTSYSIFEQNRELTSSAIVTKFIEELKEFENKTANNTALTMFAKSSDV